MTIAHGSVTFASRNGLSYDTYFPELKDLPTALALSTGVADGEIVEMDSSGIISFQAIQPRLRRSSFGKAEDGPHGISLYLFDLLFKDGKDLRKLPLRERRALLSKTLWPNDRTLRANITETLFVP